MYSLSNIIGQTYNNDAFQRVIFIESHDTASNKGQRIPEAISPRRADSYYAKKRSTLGSALVLTAPGIPMLFMGQEFLSWADFDNTKPLATTMPLLNSSAMVYNEIMDKELDSALKPLIVF